MTSRLSFETEIAFESTINETPAWKPVTRWVKGWESKRGRSFALDNFETGQATVTLDNADDRFSPAPFLKISNPTNNLFPSEKPGDKESIPGAPYFPVSLLKTYGSVAVTVSAFPDLTSGCARVAMPALAAWTDILSFPEVPVIDGTEQQFAIQLQQADWSQPEFTIGLFVQYMNSQNVSIGYAHGTTPVKITYNSTQSLIFKNVAPVGAVKASYRLVSRAANPAGAILITSAHAYNAAPYIGEPDWYFSQEKTTIVPNRRLRIHSVIGNNVFPRWATSPMVDGWWQQGFDGTGSQGSLTKIPPAEKWEFPRGPSGETWWDLGFRTTSRGEPSPGIGTQVVRFSYRKSRADAVPGTSLKIGANSIYTQTAPVPFANYAFSGWVKWTDENGHTVPASGTPLVLTAWAVDQVNPSNTWTLGTLTLTPTAEFARFALSGTMPWGMVAPQMKLTFNARQDSDRSTIAGDFGIDISGLQCARTDSGYKAVPFRFGDGAEPVYSGFIDSIRADNNWTFGANDVRMECSDDLRIFSDTSWNTPYQAVIGRNQNVIAHFPLTDPVESYPLVGEASGYIDPSSQAIWFPYRQITYAIPGFVNGTQNGTCMSFGPDSSGYGTVIDITDPALRDLGTQNKDRAKGRIDKGYGTDFWVKLSSATIVRPTSGILHYTVLSLGNTVQIGVALSPTNDCLFANTGTEGSTYLLMPMGYLLDNQPHFLSVSVGPADNATGKRAVTLNADNWAYRKTYVSQQSGYPWTERSTIAGHYNDGTRFQYQFTGQLSCLTIYDTGAEDVTAKWTVGRNNPNQLGTARTTFLTGMVHPRYDVANWRWGAGQSPANFGPLDFSGINALSAVQDVTQDCQSAFFATREGRIGYLEKGTVDALMDYGSSVPGNEMTFYANRGEGPEPGYTLDYDLSRVYNVVTFSRKGGISKTSASAASVQQFGRRTYRRELKVIDDSWVISCSRQFLKRWANPIPRLSALQWNLASNDTVAAKILSLDLIGRVVIREDDPAFPGGMVYRNAYRVESISHRVAVNGESVEWLTTMDTTAVK
ncbi:hypothetical protein [Kitasatospora sp. NPDC056800]|uniref:hypothetical protein n=1 Tax=Kitasatospora sp. NPDC056800 TaxID=3345948 RepID=UPI0036989EC8